ncbi:peptide/nickel transport system substrate-binding protein [Murinocardiopsis flavida]|uniref:Peptide/nickel transport system substrate-binding protein n=1 Tax=Murinocardiopsis flavida TaxID=645275 RepID=A0A2P8DSZ4_9ACTN|nr:ABC transporter substrate-binding protein [Murinocardiopsis flavida]PSL00315.1 peptide/nickel transport system substrate-binding protein [Murinocardiopsis flavida]
MCTSIITRSAALVSVGVLGLTACGGAGGGGDDPELVSGGTFVTAVNGEVNNTIPMTGSQPQERQVMVYAYESLIYSDEKGESEPWLAESWEEGDDGTSVTFTLKEGVTCHDGTDFTAEAAAANLNYHADPDNTSVHTDSLVPAGLKATGDGRTLEVTAPGTDPFLLSKIGTVEMVCAAGLEDPDSLQGASNGTGLYELTETRPDAFVYTTRKDYDWGPGGLTSKTKGVPDGMEVRVVTDESTRANLLISGELNAARISGTDRARVEDAGYDFTGVTNPIGQMLFNERDERPTHDPLVREALVTGFDHKEAAEVVTGGHPVELESLITESPYLCVPENGPLWDTPEHDPKRAGALLDEAGWKLGADGRRHRDGEKLEIAFAYDAASATHAPAAELLREYWLEIGVETDLEAMDGAAWSEHLYETFDWDTGWIQISSGGPTIQHAFYGGATPDKDGLNFMATSSDEYDEIAERAFSAAPDEACGHWEDAERLLVEEFHTFPLAGTVLPTFMNGAVFEETSYIQAPSIRMTE